MPRNRPHAGRQQQERRPSAAERQREYDEYRRNFNNALKFWRMCTEARCRRARGCVGDMHACFERHWAMIPEAAKVWFRTAIKARVAGHPAQEASAIGDAAVKRWEEIMASGGAAVPAAASPAAPDADSPAPPRLRTV